MRPVGKRQKRRQRETQGKLPDVQSDRDWRRIPLAKVGIKDIRYPIVLRDRQREYQHTIASITMYVDLPHRFRGTHMSRFIEILNEFRQEIELKRLPRVLARMKEVFAAQTAHIEIAFPYFVSKAAPVTRSPGLMEYRGSFVARSTAQGEDAILGVEVPVTTLCPCSKRISRQGAHNQRSWVRIRVRYRQMVWLEDLIALAEKAGSAPIYSVLKRPDERWVTERAYTHPRFVEDVVREVVRSLKKDSRIWWYRVEAENQESIHNHSAYAQVEDVNGVPAGRVSLRKR